MKFTVQNQTLLNTDWRRFLPTLDDGSVDLLVTDPPYGTTNIEWDKKIDLAEFWAGVHRVCKPNAVMIVFAAGKFVPQLVASNVGEFRYELIWEKTLATGHLDANFRPMRIHEQVLIFTRNGIRQTTYNPQKTVGKPHVNGGQHKKKPVHYSGANRPTKEVITDLYHPKSVLKYCNKVRGRSLHPTAKPLELVEFLVRSYSNEGDVVLDPFVGSGTTLAACMIAKRMGLGCEISPEYFETAKQRLAELKVALDR